MSKIGKQPIEIPTGVDVKIEGGLITVKGPKGEIKKELDRQIKAEIKDKKIIISPVKEVKRLFSLWGLSRMLVFNMIEGVTKGYEKKLDLEGVGFKVALQGKDLVMSLGFSHPVVFKALPGIELKVEKNTITVSGIEKDLVGQAAADLRDLKRPEPYKGKGLRYQGEVIKLKAGKKAVKGGF